MGLDFISDFTTEVIEPVQTDEQLIEAGEYVAQRKAAAKDEDKEPPPRDLRLETFGRVLERELPLLGRFAAPARGAPTEHDR